jgi:ribosomal protein S18 acetylase RimI-like enzyme
VLTRRPAAATDLEALTALYAAYDEIELGGPEMDAADIAAMLSVDGSQNLVLEDDGRLVGFADVGRSGEVETLVDLSRPDAADLQHDLLGWVLEQSRQLGLDRVEHFAGARPDGSGRRLAAAGFEHVRTVWRMRRALEGPLPEPVWPAGVEVRPFDGDRDGRAVWSLVQRGFAGTFGSHERPFQEWAAYSLGPEKDAVCAYEDGALIAVATTGPRVGEGHVMQLTVDHPHRGRGLALALLHEAFRRDAAAGRTATSLTVDGENAHARRLYDKAGMAVTQEFHRWERDV